MLLDGQKCALYGADHRSDPDALARIKLPDFVRVRGVLGKYEKRLLQSPGPWLRGLGRFGHVARGVVIAITGGFLITAAVRFHSRDARGLEGALDALREQPFGPWLLLATALGLTAFGVWSFVEARLRHMPAAPPGPACPRALARSHW